jgi:hypothetical protein
MKQTSLLILLFLGIQLNFAQNFAPVGAIWHYTQSTINPQLTSYKTIESVSDTTINGIQCRKLKETEHYLSATGTEYHYMYSKNDSVFFFKDNNFHLLYDFGANKGDTIVLNYYRTNTGKPLKMIIDSVGTVMVNKQERKIQHISCGDGISIEFGHHVIQEIGNTSFMFPTLDFSINGPLRCYQDNTSALFLNPYYPYNDWNHQDCEQIITGINDIKTDAEITIYPNPAKTEISILNIERNTEYKIRDITGKTIKQGILTPSDKIDINDFAKGIYLIQLNNNKLKTTKKIIRN